MGEVEQELLLFEYVVDGHVSARYVLLLDNPKIITIKFLVLHK